MEEKDKAKLKKLAPEQRIKRLRELEEERKKDLDETAKLIKDSINELHEQQEEMPEPKPVVPPKIFEESVLEQQVRAETEEARGAEEKQNVEYALNIYSELADMTGSDNPYNNISRASEIYEKIKETEQYQSQDQAVKNIAEGSRRIMKELFGEYHANLEYR